MILFDTLDTEETAREFRRDRLEKIDKGEVWSPMSEGPYCVLHWLPVSKVALFSPDDLNLKPADFCKFVGDKRIGGIEAISSPDSVRIYSDQKDEIQEGSDSDGEKLNIRLFWNVQIFRSGALEMTHALSFFKNEPDKKEVPLKCVLDKLRKTMDEFKKCMSHFKITLPVIVEVSFLHVLNCKFFDNSNGPFSSPFYLDEEQIVLMGMPTRNLVEVQNIEEIELPVFNRLWRRFGYQEGCRDHYDRYGMRTIS